MSFDFNLDIDDLFNGDVVGFAVDAFDTFVWDTGWGAQTDKVGSIWQQGWDMVDNLWGDDKPSTDGGYQRYLDENLLTDTPDARAEFGAVTQEPQGLLSRVGDSISRKVDKELESGDWVGDVAKGGVYAADKYYSKKNREEELEKLVKLEQDKARMKKHGFTGRRGGFAR